MHRGVFDVLEETGVVVQHEKALDILHDNGCAVDKKSNRVKFPSYLVEECLRKCPSSFTVKARNPKYDIRVGDPRIYFSSWAGKEYINLDTLERRPPNTREWINAIKTLDYLDEVHWAPWTYGSLEDEGSWYSNSVSFALGFVYVAALYARYTEKPFWLGGPYGVGEWSMRICETIGATGIASVTASPPLTWHKDQIDSLFLAAEHNIPVKVCSGLAAGANGPATLAGALVQNISECVSGIVMSQIVKPGIGVIPHDYSQPLDMRTGQVIQGGIERGLMGAAFAQIWRKYDIPSMTMICSDAHVPDYQCAMEKVMSITLQALAGSNMICFIGGVYDELTYSPEVSIIDNDIAKMVGRMLNGINTDISALAVDLIKEVGPIPGHYLNKKHTRETWKQEQLIPDLSNRLSHSEWAKEGQKDIITRAREKFQEIVEKHEPAPLTKEQDQEIENILTAARKHYAKLGLA